MTKANRDTTTGSVLVNEKQFWEVMAANGSLVSHGYEVKAAGRVVAEAVIFVDYEHENVTGKLVLNSDGTRQHYVVKKNA